MKIKNYKKTIFTFSLWILVIKVSFAQLTLPYVFENNSRYSDEEIYIGLVGKTSELGDVWMDMSTSEIKVMSADDNTIPGPDFSYPREWLYPEIFTKLSDLNNQTIQIPHGLSGCRIFISFESPMYLHFHETGGYAGANLNNPGDPNDGIRWEIVELTWGDSGLWTNTSRVDAYQYPMGLEVNGFSGGVTSSSYEASYNNAINGGGTAKFKKIGEVLSHDDILAAWDNTVSDPYLVAKVIKENSIDGEPIIEQPSKVSEFSDDILDGYIDEIWETYKDYDLVINVGDRGTWVGRVQADDTFLFVDPADGSIATIHGKPTTIGAMEGSGFLAYTPYQASVEQEKYDEDLMIQAQMAAAISRHAIYTDVIDGTIQYTHDADRFFVIEPYNEYVKFFHDEAISFESQTYAFAYDDVGDHSSTIQTTFPTNVKVIIGGYSGLVSTPATFIPDPNKNYYINSPVHDLRIASSGNDATPFTTSTTATGADVEWKFVDYGNGNWQIERAAGGAIPRLCSDDTENASMQTTTSNGDLTYYEFTEGATLGTYFITLPDGPENFRRLQVNATGDLKMVSTENDGAYESFTFTEVTSIPAITDLFIQAEDYTFMNGIQIGTTTDETNDENFVGWVDAGDWLEYRVDIPDSGMYTMDFRLASAPGSSGFDIQVNGEVLTSSLVESSGGWHTWYTETVEDIYLSSGIQTIRLQALEGSWNINWLELINTTPQPTLAVDDSYTTDEELAVVLTPLTGDTGLNGATLIVASIGGMEIVPGTPQEVVVPEQGTVTLDTLGNITFTPLENFNGTVTIPYIISDGNGGTATANEIITVNPINDAPVAVDDLYIAMEDNGPITLTPLTGDSDADGDSLTVTSIGGTTIVPGTLQEITIAGQGTVTVDTLGNIIFEPVSHIDETATIPYVISDGNGGTATANEIITIISVNDIPVAVDDNYTTDEELAVALNPLTGDSDVDGDTLTVTSIGGTTILPGTLQQITIIGQGILTVDTLGNITFTSLENFNGTVTIPYIINDSNGGTATANEIITVNSINDAPVAVDDLYIATEDNGPIILTPLTGDSDVDGDSLTVISIGGTTIVPGTLQEITIAGQGIVTVDIFGNIIFEPVSHIDETATIPYVISDGNGGTATANQIITIISVNDTPVAVDNNYTTDEELAVVLNPLTGDSDVDGDTLTVTSINGTTIVPGTAQQITITGQGIVSVDTLGNITFTSLENFNGTVTIPYIISDGNGGTDTADIIITVNQINDITLSTNSISLDKVLIYPNPVSETLTLSLEEDLKITKIEIFDLTGKKQLSKIIFENLTNIDLKEISSGIYFIRLFEGTDLIGTRKLIKM